MSQESISLLLRLKCISVHLKLPRYILKSTLAQPRKRKHEIMINTFFLIPSFTLSCYAYIS